MFNFFPMFVLQHVVKQVHIMRLSSFVRLRSTSGFAIDGSSGVALFGGFLTTTGSCRHTGVDLNCRALTACRSKQTLAEELIFALHMNSGV